MPCSPPPRSQPGCIRCFHLMPLRFTEEGKSTRHCPLHPPRYRAFPAWWTPVRCGALKGILFSVHVRKFLDLCHSRSADIEADGIARPGRGAKSNADMHLPEEKWPSPPLPWQHQGSGRGSDRRYPGPPRTCSGSRTVAAVLSCAGGPRASRRGSSRLPPVDQTHDCVTQVVMSVGVRGVRL